MHCFFLERKVPHTRMTEVEGHTFQVFSCWISCVGIASIFSTVFLLLCSVKVYVSATYCYIPLDKESLLLSYVPQNWDISNSQSLSYNLGRFCVNYIRTLLHITLHYSDLQICNPKVGYGINTKHRSVKWQQNEMMKHILWTIFR